MNFKSEAPQSEDKVLWKCDLNPVLMDEVAVPGSDGCAWVGVTVGRRACDRDCACGDWEGQPSHSNPQEARFIQIYHAAGCGLEARLFHVGLERFLGLPAAILPAELLSWHHLNSEPALVMAPLL